MPLVGLAYPRLEVNTREPAECGHQRSGLIETSHATEEGLAFARAACTIPRLGRPDRACRRR